MDKFFQPTFICILKIIVKMCEKKQQNLYLAMHSASIDMKFGDSASIVRLGMKKKMVKFYTFFTLWPLTQGGLLHINSLNLKGIQ